MKIVFISHRFPAVTQTFTYNEVMGLKKEGLDVQAYSFKKAVILNLTREMREAIKETIYLPFILHPDIIFAQFYFLFLMPLRYLSLLSSVCFAKHQQYNNAKLILQDLAAFLRGTYLAFILKDKRNFTHIHAQLIDNAATVAYICKKLIGIDFSFGSHTSFNAALIYKKIKEADFVISCSKFDKTALLSGSSKEFADKIYVIYLGATVNLRQEFPEDDDLMLSVGTLTEKKGHEFLIRACKVLKDNNVRFRCIIVGDGTERERLEDYIKKWGLKTYVEITGYKPHTFVIGMMKKCSVFALPCVLTKYKDMDGIPVVLMEAMALGKPCISTRISGIPELVEDNVNGLLVPQRDPIALAKALRLLLKDNELRTRFAVAAKHKIDRDFNGEKNMHREAELFRKYI